MTLGPRLRDSGCNLSGFIQIELDDFERWHLFSLCVLLANRFQRLRVVSGVIRNRLFQIVLIHQDIGLTLLIDLPPTVLGFLFLNLISFLVGCTENDAL